MQDKIDDIPITIFGDLVKQVNNEGMTVTLTDLRVSKYMTVRLLKSIDTTTFQVSDKQTSKDPKDLRDVNRNSITATIVSVDLPSLNQHLVCLKCKQIVVLLDHDDDDELGKNIFIWNACNSMVDETQCKSVVKVVFLAQTQKLEGNTQCCASISCYRVWCSNSRKNQIRKIDNKISCKHKIQCSRF